MFPFSVHNISFIQYSGNIDSVSDAYTTSYKIKGFLWHGKEVEEEMKKLQDLSAEKLMETCQSTESKDGAIRCPIPWKSSRYAPILCSDLKLAYCL
jgi:hypothetical protein